MEVKINALAPEEKPPMDLLLLADPSEKMIEKYVHSGACYVALSANQCIGACVLQHKSAHEAEIMNMSVAVGYQRKGVGKALIEHIVQVAKEQGLTLLRVKTADVSEQAIDFYEKMKFVHDGTVKGHFVKYYDQPIMENGRQAIDQVMMKRTL